MRNSDGIQHNPRVHITKVDVDMDFLGIAFQKQSRGKKGEKTDILHCKQRIKMKPESSHSKLIQWQRFIECVRRTRCTTETDDVYTSWMLLYTYGRSLKRREEEEKSKKERERAPDEKRERERGRARAFQGRRMENLILEKIIRCLLFFSDYLRVYVA